MLNAPPGRDYCNILPGQPTLSNRIISVKSIGTLSAPELFISAMLQFPNRHIAVSNEHWTVKKAKEQFALVKSRFRDEGPSLKGHFPYEALTANSK